MNVIANAPTKDPTGLGGVTVTNSHYQYPLSVLCADPSSVRTPCDHWPQQQFLTSVFWSVSISWVGYHNISYPKDQSATLWLWSFG